jgi:glycosyltransferase involved in cell wall biosynthesis
MARLYFDVSDVLDYARRHSTLTGIPRVQFNLIRLLSRRHGPEQVRCVFFDRARGGMFEFALQESADLDAEHLLLSLGLARPSRVFPSSARLKSYLRRYDRQKLLRTWKKTDALLSALLWPGRLRRLGLAPSAGREPSAPWPVAAVRQLPARSSYVCLGSSWEYPPLWEFARMHRARGGDVVQMMHDLIPVTQPPGYSPISADAFRRWLDRALGDTSRFVCNSNWTRADLRSYAHARGAIVSAFTVPLAHEFIGAERGTGRATEQGEEPPPASVAELGDARFVLCVGTLDQRKNAAALLDAWVALHGRYPGALPLLVFAGRQGTAGEQIKARLADSPLLRRYVRIVHSPADADLVWLYRHALFSAYPSLAEGWGLPVGESAWFGRYCVASSATSVPEVCGDLIDYFPPADADALLAALERPMIDAAFLRQRERRIAAASLRRWTDVADELFVHLMTTA